MGNVDESKAKMFDAIRDFFVELVSLAKVATTAVKAEVEKSRR